MMNRRLLLIVYGLSLWLSPLLAQSSVFSLGVRGGGQLWLPKSADPSQVSIQCGPGGNGVFDLRYSFYGCMANDIVGLGFTLGAGVGYGSTAIDGTQQRTFTNTDYLDNPLEYTTEVSFRRADRFATGEASLMLALGIGGFVLNIGPRFMLPFNVNSTNTITDATITAYLPTYDVPITNEAITGRLNTPYTIDDAPTALPQYQVLLGVEAGWEFVLSREAKGWMGVQLYADLGVWDSGSENKYKQLPILVVSSIPGEGLDAPVKVNSPDGWIQSRRYLDFGVRVYYSFPVGANSHERRINTRDTRGHRNRYRYY